MPNTRKGNPEENYLCALVRVPWLEEFYASFHNLPQLFKQLFDGGLGFDRYFQDCQNGFRDGKNFKGSPDKTKPKKVLPPRI